jgi:hypothetical protein
MIKEIFLVIILSIGSLSSGSGIITLDGNFYGKTEKTFMLQLHNQIYILEKSKLTSEQFSYLNSLHWKDKFSIAVAMDAIKDVHDKK